MPNSERATADGYILRDGAWAHRLIVSEYLGVALGANVEIHHADENPANNTPRNLVVLLSEEHDRLHAAAGSLEDLLRDGLRVNGVRVSGAVLRLLDQMGAAEKADERDGAA